MRPRSFNVYIKLIVIFLILSFSANFWFSSFNAQGQNFSLINKSNPTEENKLTIKNIEINENNVFDLERSIKTAIKNNQNIDIAQAKIEESEAKLKKINRNFLPEISADFYKAYALNEENNITSSAVILKQPIYTGGKLTALKKKASIDVELAELDLKKEINKLILQVKKTYFTILVLEEYKKIAEESVKRLKDHLSSVKKKYEEKLIPKTEILKVEVQLTKAEYELEETKRNLKTAKETFNSLLDRDLDAGVEIVHPSKHYIPISISLNEFLRIAYKNRPELQKIEATLINNELDVKLAKSKKHPQISFVTRYEWEDDIYIDRNDAIVGLSATWSVWDWGKNNQAIEEAKSRVKQTRSKRILTKKKAELELREAYYNLQLADKTIELAKKNLKAAEEYFKKEKIRFKNGLATNRDVLDAHLVLTKAKHYYATTVNAYGVSKANLSYLAGVRFLNEVEKPSLKDLTDDEFLNLISRKAFYYFMDNQHPKTGLFADSAGSADASIAVSGFGLTALCIGAERGWIDKEEAENRALKCINTFIKNTKDPNDIIAEGKYGFFYHFLDMDTAKRVKNCEVSTVDTALLLCGAITAGEYFGGIVKEAAESLYKNAQWDKFLNKNRNSSHFNCFTMGWTPEGDFHETHWDFYSDETMLINLLAIGSPTYSVNPNVFYSFTRKKGKYKNGELFIYSWNGALFTYQYAHAWFDFRGLVDKEGVNWWHNSINASIANRKFCIDNSNKYITYGPSSWGITSCELRDGRYVMHFGVPPCGRSIPVHDGTISPSGAAGSIIFIPFKSLSALKYYYTLPHLWGVYGFKDSFNIDKNWYSQKYYGLGKGIELLMIENFRTGFVWKHFMKNQHVINTIKKAGLKNKNEF